MKPTRQDWIDGLRDTAAFVVAALAFLALMQFVWSV